MMKTIAVLILAIGANAQLRPHPQGLTLKQWINQTECLNLAAQPLMNTQFAQLGALDALNDARLLKKVSGVSGVSSGAFVMAMVATGSKNFRKASRTFRSTWPGWANLVPSGTQNVDPYISHHYTQRVLNQVLPASFEELKIPLGVVSTAYDDDTAALNVDGTKSQPMVVSDGDLREAVLVSSSAMMGSGCPRCSTGFSAKTFRGHWPTADGFLHDEYGTLGLAALDPCPNLLHIQPQNFAQQLTHTKNRNLDLQPQSVVTLGIDVPSSGIMSMMYDNLLAPLNRFRRLTLQGNLPSGQIFNADEIWEKIEYETAYDHMKEQLDQPMEIDPKAFCKKGVRACSSDDEEEHYFVDLNLKKHWDNIRGWAERSWDLKFDEQHTKYWDKTEERRNHMVKERNEKIAAGELSFKACGNGMGAPKCNALGRRIPKMYKGKAVPVHYSAEQGNIYKTHPSTEGFPVDGMPGVTIPKIG